MKALQYHDYGERGVLALEDIADPGLPRGGQVRVKVLASSINPVDAKVRRGELRLIAGGHFPKRPGLDFCGVVEALGDEVGQLSVGQLVYGAAPGMSEGAFVEHLLVRADAIAPKPALLDVVTAAGVPTVAAAALQVLRDTVQLRAGDRLLVHGCTGGVGLYALQLARQAGAFVAGVCGTEGVTLARAFGADEVFDYRLGQAPDGAGPYRAILALSGKLAFDDAQSLLADNGLFVDFSPSPAALIGNTLANPFRSRKHVFALTGAKTADLQSLARGFEDGSLRPAPTRVFPLAQFDEAFAAAESGGVAGKIVVRIQDAPELAA